MFLLYHWGSFVTLELISLIPLVGFLEENPLAAKLLENRLYMLYFENLSACNQQLIQNSYNLFDGGIRSDY